MRTPPLISYFLIVTGLAETLRIMGLELPAVTALQVVWVHAELMVAVGAETLTMDELHFHAIPAPDFPRFIIARPAQTLGYERSHITA